MIRKPFVAAFSAALLLNAASLFGVNHSVIITEVMTGADGDTSIQFIELEMLGPGEDVVDGVPIIARNADGSVANTVFTFPVGAEAALVGLANRKILIATTNFAARAGITPDFTFAGGLFPGSGQVDYTVGDQGTMSYGSYTGPDPVPGNAPAAPGSNLNSLQRTQNTFNDANDFVYQDNSPTNNAQQTGHVSSNASVHDWALYY